MRVVAADRGVPPARFGLVWLLGRPSVTARVVGATKLAHLDDAISTVDLRLCEDEQTRFEAP